MNRYMLATGIGSLLLQLTIVNAQSHRIFLQQSGADPNNVPLEGATIVAKGGDTIVLDAYIEQAPPGRRVNGVQVAVPCNAMGGVVGTINYNGAIPAVYDDRPDFLYYGPRYCNEGQNVGLVCETAADCPGAAPHQCTVANWGGGATSGPCPAGIPHSGVARWINVPAVVVTTPRYVSTFRFIVSEDAEGSFTITVPYEPSSASRDQDDAPIPFITSGATIVIPTGKCCMGTQCAGIMTEFACDGMEGAFRANLDCGDPCCDSYSACDDDFVCTFERCNNGSCEGTAVRFGDTNGSGGIIDLDDILCINNGFAGFDNCPNADIVPSCTGNGIINLDDILAVLTAFAGADPCGCNP